MSNSGWPCRRATVHRCRHANSRHHRRSQQTRYRLAPSTPLLRWSSILRRHRDIANGNGKSNAASYSDAAKPAGAAVALSSRKLAAGLWHLRFNEISAAEPCDHMTPQLESSSPYPNCVAERATKRRPERHRDGDTDVCYVLSHRKILASRRVIGASIVSELAKARSRIRDLEAKKHSLRNKVKQLLSKLEEERTPRLRRDEAINELRDKLVRERKSRLRMEILNTKLVNQLAKVNLSSDQMTKDYEEEKRSRELLEGLCDKLVQRISDDEARVERLRRECADLRDELEEERKMLQLAEVWREERVQMKLVDAKLALEGKFSMMNSLITELETLLRYASCSLDVGDLRKAEQILQAAADSLSLEDMVDEFTYTGPKSDDVMRELQECLGNSRAKPEINRVEKNHLLPGSDRFSDDSESQPGYQSANCSPERRKVSVIQCSPISAAMSEGSGSVLTKEAKYNVSPVSKIRGPKSPDPERDDGKISNATISSVETTLPVREAAETEPRRRCQRMSGCLENPHVARGMKGCIEWPRVIHKNVVKPKFSQAIIESQKSQLRHILKSKTWQV